MKKSILFFACLTWLHVSSQSPIPYEQVLINSSPLNTAANAVNSNKIKTGNPYSVTGNGNITLNAATVIQMIPNTMVTGLSVSGLFHAQINPNTLNLMSFHTNGFINIPQYDRFEVGIILPTNIQQQIDNFLATGNGISPYDPSSMKVKCTYVNTSSNHTFERYGFYYADYSATANNVWQETPTNYKFRVRFAPPETGTYNCKIEIYFNDSPIPSQYISEFIFNVSSSTNKGHLTVAGWQYGKLQYEDGTKFFAIGENIACAQPVESNPNFLPFLPTDYGAYSMSTPNTHEAQRTYISDLAVNGGNFVRIRLDNWSVPIVSRDKPRDVNYVSKSKQRCLRDYHHNQMFMWEMDKTLGLCEQEKVKIMLNLFGDYDYSIFSGYNSKNMWDENPFSSLFPLDNITNQGNDAGIMDFFDMQGASQESLDAKKYTKNMLYYIQARWGYSTSVAMWEMMNETENLGNRNGQPCLYKSYPSFVADVKDWQCDNSYYIGNLYPQHIGTTGTIDPSINGYNKLPNQCLNVYSSNSYQTDYNSSVNKYESFDWHRWEEAKNNYDAALPFIYGEIGLSDYTNVLERYGDISFHNSVWNSVFSGAIGTALNWQDWEEPIVKHRKNFKALRQFIDMIDFSEVLTPGSSFVNGLPPWFVYEADVLTYWLANGNKNIIYGWTRNTTANWTTDGYANIQNANPPIYHADPNSNISNPLPPIPYTAWITYTTGFSLPHNGTNIYPTSEQSKVSNLTSGQQYKIDVYAPNANSLDPFTTLFRTVDSNGDLNFGLTMPYQIANGLRPDYAFIATKITGSRMMSSNKDSLPEFNTDGLTLNNSLNGTNKYLILEYVYPTPASDKVFLNLNFDSWKNPKIYLIDALGRIFEREINSDSSVNVNGFANGSYLLKVKDQTHEKSFKIIIVH